MLGQDFGDGFIRSAFSAQFRDELLRGQQFLELGRTFGLKFRDDFSDEVGIKRGHTLEIID